MSRMIKRLEERCKPSCMLCVRDCAVGVWRAVDGKPTVVDPGLCNRCGHCVAVCPNEAIVHEALDPMQIRSNDRSLLSPDVYREVVRGRRSIRSYQDKEVPREVIEHILKLASHSPTASNKQEVAYSVITDKRRLDTISTTLFGLGKQIHQRTQKGVGRFIYRLLKGLSLIKDLDSYLGPMDYYILQSNKGRDYILHRAPVLILIHAPRKGRFHCENCNIAAANIMNYAYANRLGTCYIGFLVLALKYSRRLCRYVQIPKGRKVYACLVMGYPAYRHRFTSSRKLPSVQWVDA